MANRKQLKKSVKMITGDLLTDCVALKMCQGADAETLDGIILDVLDLYNEYVARISHSERGAEKTFYRKFKEEFTEKVNSISDRILKA